LKRFIPLLKIEGLSSDGLVSILDLAKVPSKKCLLFTLPYQKRMFRKDQKENRKSSLLKKLKLLNQNLTNQDNMSNRRMNLLRKE